MCSFSYIGVTLANLKTLNIPIIKLMIAAVILQIVQICQSIVHLLKMQSKMIIQSKNVEMS